jgi:putative ABC transport system permease protein
MMRRLFHIGTRATVDREIDEELRFHIDARIEDLCASGYSREAAERLAIAEYGDVHAARAELASIDRRRVGKVATREFFESWMQDVRFALRSLRTRPGFTLTVLATLAIGIGANAAIFSVVDSVLLRQLPFTRPDQLVHITETARGEKASYSQVSYLDYLDWVTRAHAFTALGGYYQQSFVLGGDRPAATFGVQVTANFFDVLGVRPIVGRAFAKGEDAPDAPRIAMISYGLWERAFGREPTIVGKTITLDGRPSTVVGVMPRDFRFRDNATDVWVPLQSPRRAREQRGNHWLRVVGRLRDGETIDAARIELSGIMRDIAVQYPRSNAEHGARVVPLTEELIGSVRPLMAVLYAAVGLLLVVACANVANLLLMRGSDREREIAVRVALGAGRGRLVRQLLTENLLLGLTGAALGLSVAYAALKGVLRIIPPARVRTIPGLAAASVDVRVVAYVAVVSLVAVLLFGLVPALRTTRAVALRSGRTHSHRAGMLRDGLVMAEVALAVLLVASAGLFGRSFMKLLAIQPGFRAERVTTALVEPTGPRYATPESRRDFFRRVTDRLRAVPGVDAIGFGSSLPLESGSTFYYDVAGRPRASPGRAPIANVRLANAEYFSALGIPLIEGRLFAPGDDERAPHVALISHALAKQQFPNEQAIGRYLDHFYVDDSVRVVGIVGDVAIGNLEDPPEPTIYLSYVQEPPFTARVVVRAHGDLPNFAAAIHDAVRAADPDAAVTQLLSMHDVVEQSPSVFLRRFPLLLVGTFALTTLALALVGVYGVVGYAVRQRTRELGIRMALGAQANNVMKLVLRQGATIAVIGVGFGVAATLLATRLIGGMLYGIGARDPATLAAVATTLAVAAIAATALPARRATRVDPAMTLRAE